MNKRGFTLIELITVIALIGVLTAIATLNFNQYAVKSQISNQTQELYGNLMEYRSRAFYEKKHWTFKISGTGYGIYSSATVASGVLPVSAVTFKRPVEYGVSKIEFDSHGLTKNEGSICASEQNGAPVDAVVISISRAQIGKKKEGESCVSANIIAK